MDDAGPADSTTARFAPADLRVAVDAFGALLARLNDPQQRALAAVLRGGAGDGHAVADDDTAGFVGQANAISRQIFDQERAINAAGLGGNAQTPQQMRMRHNIVSFLSIMRDMNPSDLGR